MKTKNLLLTLLVSGVLAACSGYGTRAASPAMVSGDMLTGSNGPVAQFMYQDASGQRMTLYVTTESV